MRVVGLDLSLTSSGIAVIEDGSVVELCRVQSKGKEDAGLLERHYRLEVLRRKVCQFTEAADLVAIEAPAYSSTTGHNHDRSGLWWLTMDWILSGADLGAPGFARPVVAIEPQLVKKYATGKGNASKDHVLAAVVRRYPNTDVSGNDEADALVLAAMASRHLGKPIDDLPLLNLEAMEKVRWPEVAR